MILWITTKGKTHDKDLERALHVCFNWSQRMGVPSQISRQQNWVSILHKLIKLRIMRNMICPANVINSILVCMYENGVIAYKCTPHKCLIDLDHRGKIFNTLWPRPVEYQLKTAKHMHLIIKAWVSKLTISNSEFGLVSYPAHTIYLSNKCSRQGLLLYDTDKYKPARSCKC